MMLKILALFLYYYPEKIYYWLYFISHRINLCEVTIVILDGELLEFKKYEDIFDVIVKKYDLL